MESIKVMQDILQREGSCELFLVWERSDVAPWSED